MSGGLNKYLSMSLLNTLDSTNKCNKERSLDLSVWSVAGADLEGNDINPE